MTRRPQCLAKRRAGVEEAKATQKQKWWPFRNKQETPQQRSTTNTQQPECEQRTKARDKSDTRHATRGTLVV
jgi:hypothetical protein